MIEGHGSRSSSPSARSARLFASRALLGFVGAVCLATAARAQQGPPAGAPGVDPAWLTINAKKKQVQFQLIASLTPANGGLNFNGYHHGGLTLSVPRGWKVVLAFRNNDSTVAHSAEVIPAMDSFPDAPTQPAFGQAFTVRLNDGIAAQGSDTVRFEVDRVGSFVISSPAAGQAKQGMWIRLQVVEKQKGLVPKLAVTSP